MSARNDANDGLTSSMVVCADQHCFRPADGERQVAGAPRVCRPPERRTWQSGSWRPHQGQRAKGRPQWRGQRPDLVPPCLHLHAYLGRAVSDGD